MTYQLEHDAIVVELTPTDKAEALRHAQKRQRNAESRNWQPRLVGYGKLDLESHLEGASAEVAVAKRLGLRVLTPDGPDGDIDLEPYHGLTLSVKSRSRPDCPDVFARKFPVADVTVFVVRLRVDAWAIIGWATMLRFARDAVHVPEGHGMKPCWSMPRVALISPAALRYAEAP